EKSLQEFNELVCATFGMEGVAKDLYGKALGKSALEEKPTMSHWLARKDHKVVAAVSTFMRGDLVSFWNGATLPEYRKQGLSTALRCLALQEAVEQGCRTGMSYLMSEGLALGICTK